MTADRSAPRLRRQSSETRDSQNKRLTTTVWVDVTDDIELVIETMEPLRSNSDDLNEWDKALDKMLWYSIFCDRRCYIPLPHWKLMVGMTFKALGGKVAVRRGNPSLHAMLARQDRFVSRGQVFRDVVQRRFDRGMNGE